ncbi:S41 family peptidase [Candidatus Hepatincolaceae symbiont of Richtersius coronifer]
MRWQKKIILLIVAICSLYSANLFAFSLFKVFKSDAYLDPFFNKYMAVLPATETKQAKYYKELFQEAYTLLLDVYIYEIKNERKKEIVQEAEQALEKIVAYLSKENKVITAKEVMEEVMDTVFNSIDAHTAWISAEESKKFLEQLKGKYKGIGILFNFDKAKNMMLVLKVFDNSPAKNAGIKKGDYIYAVEGKTITKDDRLEEIVNNIRGEAGTKVKIGIFRINQANLEEKVSYEVTRGNYYVPSVEYKILDDKYGYININSFNDDTASSFRNALEAMKINELKGLILDVRNNAGGLLNMVILISDSILSGDNIVAIKGRNINENKTFTSLHSKQIREDLPIIVLINSMSASASELLAGALGMNNRAIIMGETSFGKWSVQTSIPLKDKSLFNITTQLFYAPKNVTFQGIGIAPDIEILGKEETKPFRENNYPKYLKAADINHLQRSAKLSISENKCDAYGENKDKILGCALSFLNAGEDLEVFSNSLQN